MQKIEEIQGQQPFAHWLNGVEGIGSVWARKLVEALGTPEEVYRASEKSLLAIAGSSRLAGLLAAQKQEVYKEYEEMEQAGIFFLPCYHPEYPKRLLQIPDSPFGIYVKGRLPKDNERSIAIVGARNCSAYGRYVADAFAKAFAKEGVSVVSGMARGIDGVAQGGALAAGGSTYAVLVVEAKQKSGTLITVDMALEQGREVYAVPGRITDRLSDGCNRLLVQGAAVALSPAQMLKELSETVWRNDRQDEGITGFWSDGAANDGCLAGEGAAAEGINKQERALLSLLDFYPISMEQIYIMAQQEKILCVLALPQMMELLWQLVVKGFVVNEGGYYGLKKPV